MGLGDAGRESFAAATFSNSTDDSPYITSAVPQAGREVDVIDEADEIDVPRITGRRADLRRALVFTPAPCEAPSWRESMTSMASMTSKPRASTLLPRSFCARI